MASLLGHIFSCCLRRRSSHLEIPDDGSNSRLIPAYPEQSLSPPTNVIVIDQQKLNDRLVTIVRSKEGKMVNVNAQIPFNLHNRPLSATFDPSSSRSASTSTHRYARPSAYHRTYVDPNAVYAVPSPSRQASISRSASNVSLRYENGFIGTEEDNGTEGYPTNPILNVRLVRAPGSPVPARRGRTRGRRGDQPYSPNASHDRSKSWDEDNGKQRQGAVKARIESERPKLIDLDDDIDATPRAQFRAPASDGQASPSSPIERSPQPTLSISPASHVEFVIHDMGAIALSWGD